MEEERSIFLPAESAEENNHGWQKVTYVKKQRKNNPKTVSDHGPAALPNGSAEKNGVFNSLEKHASERRRKLEAQRASAAIYDDEIPVRSRKKRGDEEDEDASSDVDVGAKDNEADEANKKEKPRKVKKPKVTVAEAAARIDDSDLASFLSGVSVVTTMPRKPLRCHKSLRHRPLSFSPFARSLAMIACAKKAKNKSQEIKLRDKDVRSASSNGKVELSDSSVDDEFQGLVQADFVFFDPKPGDFHGVKVLLQTYLDHKQWDLSGFVDLVLEQPTVGTVVKIENDEDDGVYSVVTVLNLERYKNDKCMTEFKDYLLEVCQRKDVVPNLKSLFGEHAPGVGIIVSQRVVNLPSQLLPPLYDALFDEIAWATEDEPTEELRNSFRFKTYIVISKIYKHKNVDQNTGKAINGDEVVIHIKPEDEILLELSSWSVCFPLHAQQVTTSELKNYRLMGLVMVVDANKVSTFRKKLHSLIDES